MKMMNNPHQKSRSSSRQGKPLVNCIRLNHAIKFSLLPYESILEANSKHHKRNRNRSNHDDIEGSKMIINDEYANSLDIIEQELFYQLIYKTSKTTHLNGSHKSKILLKKNALNRKNEELTTSLIINTILALITYYLRANCIKNFSIFQPHQTNDIMQFRNELFNLASKYYGLAINKLRKLLTLKNHHYYYYTHNITIGLICSSLLNKTSIYQYSNLNHSITFSKGFISIFNDLLSSNDDNAEQNMAIDNNNNLTWIVNFLIFASKTIYFPPYNPKLLLEFKQVLDKFKQILTQNMLSSHGVIPLESWTLIIFNFNHLYNYLNQLLQILATTPSTTDISPIILYKLLRHWLIILPSKIFIVENLINQFEICLMYLFKTLTHILDNIFPQVNFFFLQNFSGNGIKLWYEPFHYNIDLVNFIHNKSNNHFELNEINKYCIRIITFLKKRYNILSIFFGDQQKSNIISPERVRSNLNEVMIHKFWNSNPIQYYNYMHLPNVINLSNQRLINLLKKKSNRMLIDPLASLYYYNPHHLNHFKINSHTRIKKLKTNTMDPIIRFHMSNLITSNNTNSTISNATPMLAPQSSPSSSSSITTPRQNRSPNDEFDYRLLSHTTLEYDHPSIDTEDEFLHHTYVQQQQQRNQSISSSSNSNHSHEDDDDNDEDLFHKNLNENGDDWFNYDHFIAPHFSHIFASALTKDYETLLLKLIKKQDDSSLPQSLDDDQPLEYINFNMDYKTGLLVNDKEPLHFILDLAKEEELRSSNESTGTENGSGSGTGTGSDTSDIKSDFKTPTTTSSTPSTVTSNSISSSTSSSSPSTTASSHVQIYTRKLQNLSQHNQEIYDIIMEFYNLRNKRLTELINNESEDDEFYDDLNQGYFNL
ncbi:hypothetical protein DFJ63DRAFT_333985 [Scheffersomyces coipomensis]|uniref:uncharacterized protein n=1 Tax=Scheffersomyces coipomensis TaxID=1788519 RepID=UPI00315D3C99